MEDNRSLKMRLSLDGALPDFGPLPERMDIHTGDECSRAAWNWIMNSAFPEQGGMDWDKMILNDPCCSPERVFFLRYYDQDIAATAIYLDSEGKARLHWVGTHAAWTGIGASRRTIWAALDCAKNMGFHECFLSTDDFRLSAIRVYKEFGFEPVIEPGDERMAARWAAVGEKLAAHVKTERRPIPLWPNGEAPDTAACGSQPQPTLDPFPIEGSKGAVVVCAGGGYSIKAYGGTVPTAKILNAAGISAFVLDYRVLPFSSVDTPIGDARRAIRAVRSLGYEKVGILGNSAGGHMAAMTAVDYDAGNPDSADPVERLSCRPDAFVSCYGATSFLCQKGKSWVTTLLGENGKYDWALRRYSAECHVTEDTPPGFIWQTAEDEIVPAATAVDLAWALAEHGVECELHIFPHGKHGQGFGSRNAEVQAWPDLMNEWLLKQGFGTKQLI